MARRLVCGAESEESHVELRSGKKPQIEVTLAFTVGMMRSPWSVSNREGLLFDLHVLESWWGTKEKWVDPRPGHGGCGDDVAWSRGWHWRCWEWLDLEVEVTGLPTKQAQDEKRREETSEPLDRCGPATGDRECPLLLLQEPPAGAASWGKTQGLCLELLILRCASASRAVELSRSGV